MNKGHGEDGGGCGLICLEEQGRERCLKELMLELRLEGDLNVLRRRALERFMKSNHNLDCSLPVFL